MRYLFLALLLVSSAPAAERSFSFGETHLNLMPPGFRSLVAGNGPLGEWKILEDDVPSVMAAKAGQAVGVKRPVLGQRSQEPGKNRFPILVFDQEEYGDFTFSTRFKIVDGADEQMAGLVFRFQNESNFYVVRASALGKNLRCYRVVNGELKTAYGPEIEVPKGVWHELSVQCDGTRILCTLNGVEAIKLVDSAIAGQAGKVGFWTMSDSVSHFVDARITYTPRVNRAEKLVRDAMEKYSRVLGLKVFAVRKGENKSSMIASNDQSEVGTQGGETEDKVIADGQSYFSREKGRVIVTSPLRDRNGEPVAAVRVVLKSFPGETQTSAVVRSQPIVQMLQAGIQSRDDLVP